MSFFDYWRSTKERGALLRRANQLRLNPSQLTLLLGDSEVRTVLQDERMVSLLPPVGMEVFRPFTVASLEEIQQQHEPEAKEQKTRKDKKATEKNLPNPAAHLETGKPLPFICGDPPPQFFNIPLEDLDPFYQSKKVFMVLSNGNIINRFSANSSCYLLSPFNPLRTVAIKILLQPFFNLFILLTVLTNCVLSFWFPMVTYVCLAIYMFEALVKVVARGFCAGHFTFLRDPWNWLDIVIISTLLVSHFVVLGKFAVLVKSSLLLKIFTCSQGLKKTVEALVQSVKMLSDIIILTGLCLSIFAMIGLQFFMGTLKHNCVIWPVNMNMTVFDYNDNITSPGNYYYIPGHHDPLVCGNQSDAERCPEGFTCMRGRNPNYGYTSYDSFFWSLLSLFRLMMQDYWENLMQLTLRAAGKANVSIFVLVFFPGCFFLLSLILAVVAMTKVEQEEAQGAEAKQREEEFKQIVEVLKRREKEQQASSSTEIPEEQDSLQKKKSATSIQANKQENVEETEEHHQPLCCTCSDPFLKGDCCGCWQWLKRQFHIFIMNPFFDLVIIICIVISTIFAAMEHYPMTYEFMEQLVIAKLVFTGIFIVEMIIKLVALGLYGYFQVRWHIFDFILLIISLVELVLANVEGLSMLGLYFVLRVFRLARWWPMLHMFLKIICASMGNLTLVLFITVFMFSVAGTQLFQKDYNDNICRIAADCQLPRWHMHDFFHTFILVFRLLCGQWIENMWDCMEVSNDGVCVVFFMVVLIIGNLLILHLFLSSLFTNDQLVDPEEKGSKNLQRTVKQTRTWILEIIWTLQGKKKHADLDHKAGDTKEDNRKEYLALSSVSSDQQILDDNHSSMAVHEAPVAVAEVEFRMPENKQEMKKQHCDVVQKLKNKTHTRNTPEDCCCNSCYLCSPFLETDTSQGTMRVLSNFRRASLCIVQHKFFEGFIVFVILLSCAALVFEDIYLEHRPILQRVLNMADLVFTFVFVVEMLLKWIAFGFKKYFTNFWCWLDFLILDVSLFSLMVNMLGYPSRPLRALRTLRVPSRFKGMRMVLKALTVMLPSMFSVLLVILVIWLVFSIMGVNLFAGKFSHCYNETSEDMVMLDQVNNKSECLRLLDQNFFEVRWKNKKFNFDNVGMGFLSLLIMGTSSGWLDIMYAAVDSTQVEDQPLYESNLYMYLYFIGFIIIGCFFTLNIFIRVFIDTIHKHRNKFGGKHVFMTEEQQKYLRKMKKQFSEKRNAVPRPKNWCLARLFDLVTTLYFEIFMVVVICFNMVALMVETDDHSVEKDSVLFWIHFIFVVIFLIEFILKIMALRKHYFRNGLNIVDFMVLIVSITGLFLADLFGKYFVNPSLFPVFRLGRLFVMCGTLHHIRCARKIWMLIMGFVMSLPALLNIGLLLFLIVYTFSIIGMFNFAYVKNEMMIDDMFNFKTFGNSIISVIMITTSSGWDGLLSPIMNQPPDCDPELPYPGNCASPAVGIVFFTSYILLFRLLVIHLFIAVILEIFNIASPEEVEDSEMLNDDHLQMFYKTWRKFDSNGLQVIQYSELADFCDALQDPLRIPKPNAINLTHLNLPLFPGDQISCLDVLHEITTQVFGESGQVDALKAKLDEIFRINSQVSCEPVTSTLPPQQTAAVIEKHVQDGNGEGTSLQTVGEASQ